VPAIITRSEDYKNYDGKGVNKDNVKAMIWAIRFGYDNDGWWSIERVAKQLKDLDANVIGLVETDASRPFNGNWDPIEFLEEDLHFYSDYGPSTLNETWGCALLSAYPIKHAERHNLPSPVGEIACLIDATIDVKGTEVDVIVTHFGNTEHIEDRTLQTLDTVLRGRIKKEANRKAIWLGYLTDYPTSVSYKNVTKYWSDVSPKESRRKCLYMFQIGLEPFDFQRIDTGSTSDTEIQISKFKVPKTHK